MADENVIVEIDGDSSGFDKVVSGLSDKLSEQTSKIGSALADLGKKAVSGAISGLWDLGQAAIETGQAFEKSMSNVEALQLAAGATSDDIAMLKQVSEEYGASTQFTMAQCADALSYMALAGWDAEQSAAALPGVLSLAAAADMDLASASDMVTDYMSAFSKSVSDYTGEALTAAEFSDKLAYAQANSNTNVQQLGEAYKNCAANMNAAGQQMDSVTAILGTLANQGLKGSESGTALSAVMRDINNSMQDGQISINGTSIAIADQNGNYRDLIDIMADVESVTGSMSETERSAALSSVFTADSIKGMNLVLNSGVDSVRKLEAGLSDCAGTADEMAKTLNDNLKGDITYLESAMDAVKNSVYEGVEPALRSLVQSVTSDVAPQLQELVNGLFGVANGTAGAGEQMQSAVSALAEWAMNLVSDYLPKILTALTDVLGQLILAITNNAPALFNALLDSLFGMADALTVIAPQLLTALAELLQQILSKLFASIPKMVQTATDFFGGILDALLELDLTSAFTELLDLLVRRLMYSVPKLAEAATEFFGSILEAVPDMLDDVGQIGDLLAESLKSLAIKILPIGMQIIKTLINGMTEALPQLWDSEIKIMDALLEAFQSVLPMLFGVAKQLIQALVNGLVIAASELLKDAEQIITMLLETLTATLPWLLSLGAKILETLADAITQLLPELLPIAIQILETLITGLMDAVPRLVIFVQQFLKTLVSFLQENLPVLIEAAVGLLQTLITLIVDNLPMLVEAALDILIALANALLDSASLLMDAAIGLVDTLIQLILDNLDAILDVALEIILAIAQGLMDNLPDLITAAVEIVLALANGMIDHLPELIDAVVKIINALVDFFGEHYGDFIQASCDIILALCDGIILNLPDLLVAIGNVVDALWSAVQDVDWLQLGIDILAGLANGLKDGLGVVLDTISTVKDNIVDGFKTFFGIHSPSKLMRDEIGQFLLPGVSIGVEDSIDSTQQDINHALDTMLNSVDTDSLQLNFEDPEIPEIPEIVPELQELQLKFENPEIPEIAPELQELQLKIETPEVLEIPEITPELQELQLKLENPEILENFNTMLSQIDFGRLQTQFDSAMQSLGFSAIAQPTQIYNQIQNVSERQENSQFELPKTQQISPRFNIYIGDTEIKDFVIEAIDQANAVSGGVSV